MRATCSTITDVDLPAEITIIPKVGHNKSWQAADISRAHQIASFAAHHTRIKGPPALADDTTTDKESRPRNPLSLETVINREKTAVFPN